MNGRLTAGASAAFVAAVMLTACGVPTSNDEARPGPVWAQSAQSKGVAEAPSADTNPIDNLLAEGEDAYGAEAVNVAAVAPEPCAPTALKRCSLDERIVAVNSYLAHRPGMTGFVLRDRLTGKVYSNEHANELVWTASTIKLAMAADLLRRNRVGQIRLTSEDRDNITAMVHSSDNDATSELWDKYAGADQTAFNRGFVAAGLGRFVPQVVEDVSTPYWGFQKCTPADLESVMNYVLLRAHPEDRRYLVHEMQNVAPIQQWGVWAAGAAERPGVKNGWDEQVDGWVINSVGFAGPGQRYTLALMNSLGDQGGEDEGVETVSHAALVLFNRID